VKARDRDYARLKKYSEEHRISIQDALSKAVARMEVKKLESAEPKIKEIELDACDECDAEVPSDAKFCPQCGAEFEDDEDEDESEDED
jgi:predicted amidophosphoribosyltransferase